MNVDKYLPINTKEKVDAIINDLLKHKCSISIENVILEKINKFKIQLYFKDRFDNIRDTLIKEEVKALPRISRNRFYEKKHTPEYKLQKLIAKIPISEISELLDISVGRIIKIAKQRHPYLSEIDDSAILPSEAIYSCIDFFMSAYTAKQRKDKLEKQELEKPSPRILEEKFKPSYGKEGNYYNLILYGPKT